MILLDTDHFTVLIHEEYPGHTNLAAKFVVVTESVCLPVVTVEEQLRGWLARIHRAKHEDQRINAYDRLIELVGVLPAWRIVRWDDSSASQFARLRRIGVRIPTQDLRIASLALSCGALLLTRNARDFSRVPGLRFESWLD